MVEVAGEQARNSMREEHSQEAQALWDFAVGLYAQPEVSRLCLRLQDEYALDVNILLYVVWTSSRGVQLCPADFSAIDAVTREWAREVVQPLRNLRRRWKSERSPEEYAGIKAVELAAEREELRLLAGIDPGESPRAKVSDKAVALRSNLELFSRHSDIPASGHELVLGQFLRAVPKAV